jgi:hypothetical protein
MKNILLIALLPLLFGISCKKDKLADELSKLPPATQTGANTFGCLVNGKAWVPQGGCFLCPSVLKFYYDNGNGGQFSITADVKTASVSQYINIGVDSCRYRLQHNYTASIRHSLRFAFTDRKTTSCDWSTFLNPLVVCTGWVAFSKLDANSGIFAGTFEYSLSLNGCETITITNGRFDAKL